MKRWIGCGAVLLGLAGSALALLVWGIATYHGLIRRQIEVDRSWSEVENVYQRRLDLVPSLLEAVRRVGNLEKGTDAAITEARAKVSRMLSTQEVLDNPGRFRSLERAQNELSDALSRLLARVQDSPQLAANRDFLALRSALESTESRISVEREQFNEAARRYNAAIRGFPGRVVAGTLGFGIKQLFDAEAGADGAPRRPGSRVFL